MKLDRTIDAAVLAVLAQEALHLLCAGDTDTLAARFGYALRYDREASDAIDNDLRRCLTQVGASELVLPAAHPQPKVVYLGQSGTGLVALVQCLALTDNNATLLIELVVTENGMDKYIMLEEISVYGQNVSTKRSKDFR